ncbi:MAG: PmoA family protein [Verrucomicrobiales bacterium]|nr:PmoA family protein [Verrucomicrobiales bacterium]
MSLALGLAMVLAEAATAADGPVKKARWEFAEVGDKSLLLIEGYRQVFVYNYGIIRRAGVPEDRARASYVHPLFGLDGEVLTDDFPADHHHHRGLFWGWPHVSVGEKKTDSWALSGITNRWERWLRRDTQGPNAILEVENGWYIGEDRVMSEVVRFTVHPAEKESRAIDLDFTWTPVKGPIRLAGAEGKSYGGLTLRIAPGTNTVITTPEGQKPEDLYITRLPWADISRRWSRPTEARAGVSGAALFIAPDHPDFPPTWLTRHYGVLCIGWPGVDGREFPVGQPIRCRYRVWIHRGPGDPQRLKEAFEEYRSSKPQASVPLESDRKTALPMRAVLEGDRVRVFAGDHLFTEYLYGPAEKLPHFFPVVGPRSGRSVTIKDGDPYPHHRSIFFGCDRVNGGNYWQEGIERGQIASQEVRLLEASGERVVFEQRCEWRRPGAEAPLEDWRRVTLAAPSPWRRTLDFEITLTARGDVRIERSNHALFSARMAPDLSAGGGGRLVNAHGDVSEAGTFGKPALWMDARGRREDGWEGLTLFCRRMDRWSPPPWFTRDYGFLSPSPMYWLDGGEVRMTKGERIALAYRVLVHADAPNAVELAELQDAWDRGS